MKGVRVMNSERAAGAIVANAIHPQPEPIPDAWRAALAPTTHCCHEWKE